MGRAATPSPTEPAIAAPALSLAALRSRLEGVGYAPGLLRSDYAFGAANETRRASLAAFAHQPMDVRSACIAVTDATSLGDESSAHFVVGLYRDLGAPLVFALRRGHLELWKQAPGGPELHRTLAARQLDSFFETEGESLAPAAIYRAKTLGRFQPDAQLDFVDIGLLPVIETELGTRLSALIEELVQGVRGRPGKSTATTREQWTLREVFWLVAAKILHDKAVPSFQRLNLGDLGETRERIARHYGWHERVPVLSSRERSALEPVSTRLAAFASLAQVTTEALAFIYENALVSDETRRLLGTHSTPTMLVDYIVGRLAPRLDELPVKERRVFEPACGHAPFLVAAMRALRDALPGQTTDEERRKYLRGRLAGLELDSGALEIARLSLTLADIPNPNGWNLQHADLFEGDRLEKEAAQTSVLLCNPPYEDFTRDERADYAKRKIPLHTTNKAFELLSRTLPKLPDGALVGLVLQRGFLQNTQAKAIRELLVKSFQLLEIILLPDRIFALAEHETVVVLARREPPSEDQRTTYRRVREADVEKFIATGDATSTRQVPQRRFADAPGFDLRVPEHEELWSPRLPRAESIADIGTGLQFQSPERRPRGALTHQETFFPGGVRGFLRAQRGGVELHALPEASWLNLSPEVIERPRRGTSVGEPQILIPYAPRSRGPWRLTAHVDLEGHAVTDNFLVARPKGRELTPEYLWALFNSPYANAYAYSMLGKRHNIPGVIRNTPVPNADAEGIACVTQAARAYLRAAEQGRASSDELRDLLLRVDAEVLRLYALPAKQERTLLRMFDGVKRPGVPFDFDHYFPPDFESAIPLHVYLSDAYRRSTPAHLLAAPPAPKELVEALRRATEDFGD